MINWFSVVANGVWLVGLALILAAFSYHQWLAGQLGQPVGRALSNPSFQRWAMIGLLLVGIGLALTAEGPVQLLPAVALIAVCIVALIALFRTHPDDSHVG